MYYIALSEVRASDYCEQNGASLVEITSQEEQGVAESRFTLGLLLEGFIPGC